MANAGAFLNLSTSSTGAKLFKIGAEPLSRSFDFVDPSDLQVFLDLHKTKSKVQGWARIFTVPVEIDGVTTNHSLLHNYGVIPLASVTSDALTYVNAESKVAQDSFMLFLCIFASLDTEFLKPVTAEAQHYHGVDTKAPQEPPIPCGALLLKIIIMKAHVDTRATVSYIRTALFSLDTKMMALDSVNSWERASRTVRKRQNECGEEKKECILCFGIFNGEINIRLSLSLIHI